MQDHFSSSNTNLYLVLAQYIDIVARKSGMTSDQVLDFPWQQFYANLDEAAQNNINEMFYQNDSKKRNIVNGDNENTKITESSIGDTNTAELYNGPFKGNSVALVI